MPTWSARELLIRCLNHHDKVIAIAASNRLKTVEIRKNRIPGLIQLCRDERVCPSRFDDLGPMPAAIVAAFKRIGADSIEPLLKVMIDPKETADMRAMAHHILCHLSGHASELARQLTPLLKHEDPEVKSRAADLMARVRGSD